VVRPESREDFLGLDFASRCAVAGLQLGRTKVFLRREAFDRIEAMRSEKFFNVAATIQKRVRGRQRFLWYQEMRTAAIIVQRVFVSRQYVMEIQLARQIAAIIIQSRYRDYKRLPEGPSDADITWAMTRIQSRWRGQQERIQYQLFLQEQLEHERMRQELFEKIKENNWAVVANILGENPELAEAIDEQSGELTLHKIARHASAWTLLIDMVLVLYPKALIHRDLMGALPIHHASAHDNLQALEIIYNAYPEGINDTDRMGCLPIHVAANYDAVDAIAFLLQMSPEGASTMVYRPSNNLGGGLPLHIACRNYSIGVITVLLMDNFVLAKRTDEKGDLPLHLLLRCGEVLDLVVLKKLLECFSDAVLFTDRNGDLPLAIATEYSCSEAVKNAIRMQFSNTLADLATLAAPAVRDTEHIDDNHEDGVDDDDEDVRGLIDNKFDDDAADVADVCDGNNELKVKVLTMGPHDIHRKIKAIEARCTHSDIEYQARCDGCNKVITTIKNWKVHAKGHGGTNGCRKFGTKYAFCCEFEENGKYVNFKFAKHESWENTTNAQLKAATEAMKTQLQLFDVR